MSILLNKRDKIKDTKRGVMVQFLLPHFYGTLLSWFALFVTLALPSDFDEVRIPFLLPNETWPGSAFMIVRRETLYHCQHCKNGRDKKTPGEYCVVHLQICLECNKTRLDWTSGHQMPLAGEHIYQMYFERQ